MASEVSGRLRWPATGQGQGPASPRRPALRDLRDCSFLASGVCSVVGETDLEVCAGFLARGASACPLVGRVGSWPSCGLGPV